MRPTLKDQRDRASRFLLYGLLVLLPLTVVFGHRGVAPWLLLAAIPAFARGDFWMSAFGELFDKPDIKNPFFAGLAAVIFFCLWIFLSGFWSPKGQFSLIFYVLGPLLVGGSVVWYSLNLPPVWTYRLSSAFALSIAAGVAVLFFEGVTDGFLRSIIPPEDLSPGGAKDITALGRGVTALAPALFPAAAIAAMVRGKWAGVVVVGTGFLAAITNDVSANVSAVAVGAVAAAAALAVPKVAIRIASVVFIALLLLAPAMALLPVDTIFERFGGIAPASWLHRVAVWQSVAAHIPEGLPFGHGADYARIWKQAAPMIDVPGSPVPLSVMPTHPHNVFLQIWLELGLPGVLSAAAFIFFGARVLDKTKLPTAVTVALIGAVGAISVSLLVEGSLWQVWRLATIALAAMGVALSYSLYRLRAPR
jgi:O-antigen ligase